MHNRSVRPDSLQPGDCVGILSTARSVRHDHLQPAIQFLQEVNLRYVLGQTIGLVEDQMAGTDAQRAADLQQMLDDPNIKAVWCAKGGYGTVRIIDQIDFSKFMQHPKWLIGYSDVTVLHSHIHKLGIETIHGQMAVNFDGCTAAAKASLRNAFLGESLNYSVENHPLNRAGTTEAPLVGGNLSMIYSLCGSASTIETSGKILFLEDLDEYLYHIDRMMMNLKRNGMLENLAGLIVGGMTQMKDNDTPFGRNAHTIIRDAVREYEYPVCFDFPAGHLKDNRTLIFGRKAKLEITTEQATLDFEQ